MCVNVFWLGIFESSTIKWKILVLVNYIKLSGHLACNQTGLLTVH